MIRVVNLKNINKILPEPLFVNLTIQLHSVFEYGIILSSKGEYYDYIGNCDN